MPKDFIAFVKRIKQSSRLNETKLDSKLQLIVQGESLSSSFKEIDSENGISLLVVHVNVNMVNFTNPINLYPVHILIIIIG